MALFAALGLVALGVVFVLMAVVRYLAHRATEKPAPTRGLDLGRLERQLAAGEISREEFEAIRRKVAGAGPAGRTGPAAAENPASPATQTDSGLGGADRPIMDDGEASHEPPRSSEDGQDR